MKGEIIGSSIRDKSVSQTKFVNHIVRTVTGFRKSNAAAEPFEMTTEVIELPSGGQIMPYFRDSGGRWKVVLVSQYRPAVKGKTIEGAGGRLDEEPPPVALSRELREEAAIKVKPNSVLVVLNEYIHPPILSASIFGGIVKIDSNMVKNKNRAGKKSENEWTQVEVFDLIELLKKRNSGLIKIDLLTSRLLDEVAKATGLLVKKY